MTLRNLLDMIWIWILSYKLTISVGFPMIPRADPPGPPGRSLFGLLRPRADGQRLRPGGATRCERFLAALKKKKGKI